jgi:hypothetical protein
LGEKGFWRAKLSLPGRSPIVCIVKDVSEGGALVELVAPVGTATKLRLYIEEHDVDIECVVRHVANTRRWIHAGWAGQDPRTKNGNVLCASARSGPDTVPAWSRSFATRTRCTSWGFQLGARASPAATGWPAGSTSRSRPQSLQSTIEACRRERDRRLDGRLS